ncbi:MAG: VCBS repeat-containing protein [Acidobacteria bacterium]|nr:VCBS repeat-containing protein [Acidobacteriota bacterium]
MSKKQKRIVFYSSPLIVLLLILGVGKMKLDYIETNAQLLAQMGQAAQKVLGEYKSGVDKADIAKVLNCYDDKYASEKDGFWVEEEDLQAKRDGVRVYQWKLSDAKPFGKAEVGNQVSRYLKTLGKVEESKFKLDSVEEVISPQSYRIRSFLWIRGTRDAVGRGVDGGAEMTKASFGDAGKPHAGSDGKTDAHGQEAFETQVLFRMWLQADGDTWKITRQELISGTTVTGDRKGFTDMWGHQSLDGEAANGANSSAGIDFVSHKNPLFATPEWEPKAFEIIKYGSAGVSAGDYDNDGWYDVFFGDGERPRLYRNKGDGTFEDVTLAAGLPERAPGINVGVFADLDNDGYKDLFLGCYTGRSRLYRNVADQQSPAGRKFVEVTDGFKFANKGDSDFIVVAAAADYDNDGDLDLYVGRELDARKNLPTTLFYTRNAEGNSLLRNDGNLHFTDVTRQAGINETGITLGVAWGDYDNDGWQDVYVANDFGRDALLHNNGNGTFTDVSKQSGAYDPGYGMSATLGDIDNDGDLDIYVSDVHSGQRWYGQAATLYKYLLTSVRQGTIYDDFPVYKEIYNNVGGTDWSSYGDKTVKGNALYINDGHGKFTDVSEAARVNPFGWFWSSTMFDYDNDGRQDIYAANGWITSKSTQDL